MHESERASRSQRWLMEDLMLLVTTLSIMLKSKTDKEVSMTINVYPCCCQSALS